MTAEQRLERLESRNRRLGWTLAALLGMVVGGCMMGLKSPTPGSTSEPIRGDVPEVIRARSFEVIGPNSSVIACLGTTKEGGGVVFTCNDGGKVVAQVGAAADGRGVVWTYDSAGRLRPDIR